ncbi:EAL domain-containing protein [Salinispirillum sp. LH 10-3-1]|uniref:cyclic-guanylate-specific phosphodiesterase n=1 Tax=Salinispirillum sp. LH 10-3-1 TaxID=2952525 RepID=A0AB38YBH1_9GAMM
MYALWVVGALVVLALVLFFGHVSTSNDQPIRVGVYENEPKIFLNDRGNPDGLFIQLIEAMAQAEKWSLEYVPCNWSDCLLMLENSELDLMPDVAFSTDRAQRLAFHRHAVVQSWSQLYVRPTTLLTDFEELPSLRLAVLRDSIQASFLKGLVPQLGVNGQVIHIRTIAEGFALVRAGDADAVVANNFFGNRHRGDYGLIGAPLTFNQVGLYFAAPLSGDEALLERIDHYLVEWQADPGSPYYSAIAEAASLPVLSVVPGWLSGLVIALMALILWFIVHSKALRWAVQRKAGELVEANERFTHLLDSSPVVVYTLKGQNLALTWVSGNVERIFGFEVQDVLSPDWWPKYLHPEDRPIVMAQRDSVLSKGRVQREYRLLDKKGKVHRIRDEQRLTQDRSGYDEVVGTWTDLTEHFEQTERLSYLAHYDALTGLPNRALLMERMAHAVQVALCQPGSLTVVFIDLDRFKNINDTLGSTLGDQVLKTVAERLHFANMPDTLARMSADEFVLLVERPLTAEQSQGLVDHIIDQLHMPIVLNGQSLVFTASIGTSTFPEDGDSAEKLLTRAEMAMFEAKKSGGNSWQSFDTRLSESTEQRFVLENALRLAVANGELFLEYQPQFNLRTESIVGVEALVRWQHPEQGVIPPSLFIALAEDIGMIDEIDAWVMQEACAQLRRWENEGFMVDKVAVNISAIELEHKELIKRTSHALESQGLSANRLELELTESKLMRAPERSIGVLNMLKSYGVSIAIDDFGTGYSSLMYLRNLPLDYLKIDQSFVRDIGISVSNDSILRAIIALAKALELNVLAEGIETREQYNFLCALGCEQGQGYLLARPMAAQQVFDRYARSVLA